MEPLFFNGQLYLGMIWHSQKALDLLRDARCTIHNPVSDRHAAEGEFKAYGHALNITDLRERERYAEALFLKINWRPEEPEYHCFAIDIHSAAANTLVGEELQHQVWRA